MTTILSCKNTKNEVPTTIKGNYIFFKDAAVLQSENQIYGVFLNAKVFFVYCSSWMSRTTLITFSRSIAKS